MSRLTRRDLIAAMRKAAALPVGVKMLVLLVAFAGVLGYTSVSRSTKPPPELVHVTYEVRGTATAADITYMDAQPTGAVTTYEAVVPWSMTVTVDKGAYVEVGAALDPARPGESGDVECVIRLADGTAMSDVHATVDARGFGVALCDGRAA